MAPAVEPQTVSRNRNAYVTFLAGDGDYVQGVVGLAKGLRKVKSAYSLVVACLPDVPIQHRRVLAKQGCLIREIDPVPPPLAVGGNGGAGYVRPYFALNYCKLRLWKLDEYSKMIYMDADVQVFENIDHLFDLPTPVGCFYGVVDCLCTMYGEACSQSIKWPQELGPPPPYYFNGGMFLFRPNLDTYNRLMSVYQSTPPSPFAEQDFLSMFFRDTMRPLPPAYNLLVAMLWRHPELVDMNSVKVVHYCVAGSKPWKYTRKEENMDREDIKMLVKKWKEIYNDEGLDYNFGAMREVHASRDQTLLVVAVGDGLQVVIPHIPAPSAA